MTAPGPHSWSRSRRVIDLDQIRNLLQQGHKLDKIAQMLGVQTKSISQAFYRNGDVASAHYSGPPGRIDIEAVKALLQQGQSLDQIAEKLGVHKASITRLFTRIGETSRMYRPNPVPKSPPPLPPPPRKRQAAPAPPPPEPAAPDPTPPLPTRKVALPRLPPAAAAPPMAPPVLQDLPLGYVSELADTKGKYAALDAWRHKFSPLVGRPISATKALQEWHRYCGQAW